MGLDSELGAGSETSHGPPEEHASMVQSVLNNVRNDGSGILVIGGDSSQGSSIREYWEGDIGDNVFVDNESVDVEFVGGTAEIAEVDFDGYALIAVASSDAQIGGGLTNAENEALIGRDLDIAAFINDGGGLIGKTQDELADPFGYVGPIGEFTALTSTEGVVQYDVVEVTPAGEALGLTTDGMSGWCCWHDVFDDFPDFMDVLVIHEDPDRSPDHVGFAAAIGGLEVVVPTGIDLEPESVELEVGDTHEVTATVEEDDGPAEDVEVTFTVTDGPHEGETDTAMTDGNGEANFSYEGTEAGTDTIVAAFEDLLERERTSNEVTVEWEETPVPEGLSLAPSEDSGEIGEDHTVTATLLDDDGDPVAEAEIAFEVTDGPHEDTAGTAETDGDGEASFTYEGSEVGTDTIIATSTPDEGDELTSNEATMEWSDDLEEIEDEAEAATPVEAEPDFTG